MNPIFSAVLQGMKRAEFKQLIARHFNARQCKLIMRAYRQAKYGHLNQKRRSGGRVFEHVKAVAILLILVGVRDYKIICAALLHDIIEDSYILKLADIGAWFGRKTKRLVKAVTHKRGIDNHKYFSGVLHNGTPSIWTLKLGDRLHNLLTLMDGTTPEEQATCRRKKLEQAAETREYILPMAEALQKSNKKHHRKLGRWFYQEASQLCDQREKEASTADA